MLHFQMTFFTLDLIRLKFNDFSQYQLVLALHSYRFYVAHRLRLICRKSWALNFRGMTLSTFAIVEVLMEFLLIIRVYNYTHMK